MKKFWFYLVMSLITLNLSAQIPYFAGTQPKDNLYGYVSTNFKPSHNATGTYTTVQYGLVEKWLTIGTDLSTSPGYAAQGFTLRTNFLNTKHIGIGLQTTSAFNLGNNYKWDYQSTGLFINGNIAGNLGYVLNTWWTEGRTKDARSIAQWSYISYDIKRFHPMIGFTFDWNNLNKNNIDLALGFYYSFGKFNAYAWGGNLTKNSGNPYVTIGIDFLLNTK